MKGTRAHVTLQEFGIVIRRRWLLILGCVLVAVGATWLVASATADSTQETDSYLATATLLVSSAPEDQTPQNQATRDVPMGQIALFVTAGEIPKRAAAVLGHDGDPTTLAADLSVDIVEGARALTISAVSTDGERSARMVNAFAHEAVRYFETSPPGTGNVRLNIVQEATPLLTPAEPRQTPPGGLLPWLALAAVIGALSGGGIALILDRAEGRLRTRRQVQTTLKVPVIAEVPRFKPTPRIPGQVGALAEPLGEYANGYRAARAALMHLPGRPIPVDWTQHNTMDHDDVPARDAQVILVGSALTAEGKTTSVANLAANFAETGQSVLVLDCDLRSPDVHTHFNVPQGAGLSDYLIQGRGPIQSLVRPTNVSGVYIVTAGTRLDHPAALTSRLAPVVDEARHLADIVLIDTAPLLTTSDVFDLLPLVDTVVLAVRRDALTKATATRVADLLGCFHVPVTGAMLIGTPAHPDDWLGQRDGTGAGRTRKEQKAIQARARHATRAVEKAALDHPLTGTGRPSDSASNSAPAYNPQRAMHRDDAVVRQ